MVSLPSCEFNFFHSILGVCIWIRIPNGTEQKRKKKSDFAFEMEFCDLEKTRELGNN